MSNQGSSACGGGGAGFKGKIAVFQDGNYDIVVGSGAISRARFQSTVDSGTATTISKDGVTLLSAGGGTGGSAWIGGASGGVGGTLVNNFTVVESEVSTNGNNGWGGNQVATSGANGPISGHTWGKSGWSSYGWAGGNVGPSYHGYLMIKYVGPAPDTYTFTITPTPSDATVTLTVDGTTYTQSSITVVSGKTVSWSVSKSGYTTQTGSSTITEDTTEIITLEELQEPLYYCYYNNNTYCYAVPNDYVNVYVTKSGSSYTWQKAQSSSELGLFAWGAYSGNDQQLVIDMIGTLYRDSANDLYT